MVSQKSIGARKKGTTTNIKEEEFNSMEENSMEKNLSV